MAINSSARTLAGAVTLLIVLAEVPYVYSQDSGAAMSRIPIIIDSDANNELDDQHALAYLFFNRDVFDIVGVTTNATRSGGNIDKQTAEAKRVMHLCRAVDIPLLPGAKANFDDIQNKLAGKKHDGVEAVDFIISQARLKRGRKLVLLPIGKITNIALALKKAPDIAGNVRVVWLGSNYPRPGDYNMVNDIPAMNYVLDTEVPFEMLPARGRETTGTAAVRVTPDFIKANLAGLGPATDPIEGRHGNRFTCFGDYSVDLFSHIKLNGDPPSRPLYDLVGVAIVKEPKWGEASHIPSPTFVDGHWVQRPDNTRKIVLWEKFDADSIINDLVESIETPSVAPSPPQ